MGYFPLLPHSHINLGRLNRASEMMISSDDMLFTFGVETVPTGSWLHNI